MWFSAPTNIHHKQSFQVFKQRDWESEKLSYYNVYEVELFRISNPLGDSKFIRIYSSFLVVTSDSFGT